MTHTNKLTKILDVIVIVIIIALAIIYVSNKAIDYQHQKVDIKCNELSKKLNNLNLIDDKYSVDITTYDRTTLRVIVDIYYYKEEMQIDFNHLFNVIYKEVENSDLKELNFKKVKIVIFNYVPDKDGDGGSGVGINEKTFNIDEK